MSTSIKIINLRITRFYHPGFPGGIPPLTEGTPREFKQVEADDYSANYRSLLSMGILIEVDGDTPAEFQTIIGTNTVDDATLLVGVVTTAGASTVTLASAATVGKDYTVFCSVVAPGGGTTTIEGDGADTIGDGSPVDLTAGGESVMLRSDGVSSWEIIPE